MEEELRASRFFFILPPSFFILLLILTVCSDVNAGTLGNSGTPGTSGQLLVARYPNFLSASHEVAAPNRGFD